MLELLAPFAGHRARVVRLIEVAGIHAPRRGPRMAPARSRRSEPDGHVGGSRAMGRGSWAVGLWRRCRVAPGRGGPAGSRSHQTLKSWWASRSRSPAVGLCRRDTRPSDVAPHSTDRPCAALRSALHAPVVRHFALLLRQRQRSLVGPGRYDLNQPVCCAASNGARERAAIGPEPARLLRGGQRRPTSPGGARRARPGR
jgi:hypothetical protein